MAVPSEDKRKIVDVVWRQLIRNTAYRPASGVALLAKKALYKLSKADLDRIGCILLTKQEVDQ